MLENLTALLVCLLSLLVHLLYSSICHNSRLPAGAYVEYAGCIVATSTRYSARSPRLRDGSSSLQENVAAATEYSCDRDLREKQEADASIGCSGDETRDCHLASAYRNDRARWRERLSEK